MIQLSVIKSLSQKGSRRLRSTLKLIENPITKAKLGSFGARLRLRRKSCFSGEHDR